MFDRLKKRWRKSADSEPASLPDGDLFPSERQDFHDDPYPFYERLRVEAPFHRTADGAWVISRHADIKEALDHPSLGNRPSRFSTLHPSKSDRFVCASVAMHIMPFLDGVAHKEQRRTIARIFQQELKTLAPQLPTIAEEIVTTLPNEFRVIEQLGHPMAVEVICRILGFPADASLREWSSSFIYLFTKIPDVDTRETVDAHLTQFRQWIDDRLDAGDRRGVMGALSELVSRGELERIVAIDSLILLFADGLENVDSGIGNALLILSQHPESWAQLKQDPSLIPSAVSEILRFDSPAQYIARTCLEDFEWQGHAFKKDLTVILLLASANRDPEAFDQPKRFDITRSPNPHLSFGQGKHSCLGGRLVEMELAALLQALAAKHATLELSQAPTWQRRSGHRWMEDAGFRLD